jgi:NADH:ubiquinone oxidoreductase subunit C
MLYQTPVKYRTADYIINNLKRLIYKIYIRQFDLEIRANFKYQLLLLTFLKNHSLTQFKQLADIVVYDVPGKEKRFTVIYLLTSFRFNTRVSVQLQVDELTPLYSVAGLFKSANWAEREVWDLFGIFFLNHKDLRRILTDYGFNGHPLRKDFPLTGFTEIYYSDYFKRIIHRPVELVQEYRNYNFLDSWSF